MRIEQVWEISITLLCSLSGYSRQAYYKQGHLEERTGFQDELIISQVISYRVIQKKLGTRKLLELLQPFMAKQGVFIGRDRLFELLRMYGLLIGKKRRRKPNTTCSRHSLRKYPNLFENLTPIAAGGVWVSDITYIELCQGSGFLSLVTDAYSRKVVGYHLCEYLNASGPVAALQMAIAGCKDTSGLIHHSDRGTQYCCNAYVEILQAAGIGISMTQTGDPRDNAIAERMNGILKGELLEEIYPTIEVARDDIAQSVNTYNYLRPHCSLEMLTPAIAHGRYGELKRRWGNHYKPRLGKEVTMDG
jgi:putative transposase